MFEKTCTHIYLARVPVRHTVENWKAAIKRVDVQELLTLRAHGSLCALVMPASVGWV